MEDALRQLSTNEIWGAMPRWGYTPTVQAYSGRLPKGAQGIEFRTLANPDRGSPPGRASWTPVRDGVRLEEDYAKLEVNEIHIVYE
jgi:hypothetical protein